MYTGTECGVGSASERDPLRFGFASVTAVLTTFFSVLFFYDLKRRFLLLFGNSVYHATTRKCPFSRLSPML